MSRRLRHIPAAVKSQPAAGASRHDRFGGGREFEGEVFVAENEPRRQPARAGARREPPRPEVVVAAAAVVDPDLTDAAARLAASCCGIPLDIISQYVKDQHTPGG
jgi:hypothetical protein